MTLVYVLIVEDEPRAANRLARLIDEIDPNVVVAAKLPSVAGTLDWLGKNDQPDLIFLDVRLEDGDGFDVLSRARVESPVVFCTAYSEYALRAFAVNSIDYLLKPVVRDDLARALAKFRRYSGYRMRSSRWPDFPPETQTSTNPTAFRRQFLVAVAGRFHPVRTVDIIAAGTYLKGTKLIDLNARQWVLDDPLVKIEQTLDPAEFIRVSRQWLVRLCSIQSLQRKTSRYRVSLHGFDERIAVSRARIRSLKERLAT